MAEVRRPERATALVLVPAMTLVLLVLAAIAVDLAGEHAAQRSVERAVTAATDDAAGMIDSRRLQTDGELIIDPAAADRVLRAQLAAAQLPGTVERLDLTIDDEVVDVRVRVRIRHLFLGVLPGSDGTSSVPVHVRARLDR